MGYCLAAHLLLFKRLVALFILYNGKQKHYSVKHVNNTYQTNRKNCGLKLDYLKKFDFLKYINKHFFEDGWSLDICTNGYLDIGELMREQVALY